MMNRDKCSCGKLLIQSAGRTSSPILLVGEFPGKEEIIRGVVFVGPTGDILRQELSRAGISYDSCRATNLWIHAKDEENCDVKIHMDALAKEIKGKTHVLVMGSDVTWLLWDCGVMDISGLEMKHELFPGVRFFVSPNPAQVMHGPIGELRLAFDRFAQAINA